MTQQEFLLYTKLYPNRVNVWYSDTAPFIIQGISIPVLTPSPNSVNISGYLQQAKQITIPLTSGGSTTVNIQSGNYVSVNTLLLVQVLQNISFLQQHQQQLLDPYRKTYL